MYCKNCGERLIEKQDICLRCGVYAGNGNRYCGNCGTEVADDAAFCMNCGTALKKQQTYGAFTNESTDSNNAVQGQIPNFHPRNIVVALILTFVTCGIYGIYWFIVLTDELNRLTKNENDFSGGLSFVFTLITCGIYSYIWSYKMGQKVDQLNGTKDGYTGILYLLLTLFSLGIVNYALIQDSVNKALESR